MTRKETMNRIKTFNLLKNAIWACVLDQKSVPRSQQQVDLLLLRNLMLEMQVLLEAIKFDAEVRAQKSSLSSKSKLNTEHRYNSLDTRALEHILKRFTVLDPANLKYSILSTRDS